MFRLYSIYLQGKHQQTSIYMYIEYIQHIVDIGRTVYDVHLLRSINYQIVLPIGMHLY